MNKTRVEIKYNPTKISGEQIDKTIEPLKIIIGKTFNVSKSSNVSNTRYERIKPIEVMIFDPKPILGEENEHALCILIHVPSSPELLTGDYKRKQTTMSKMKELKILPDEIWNYKNTFISTILIKAYPPTKFKS